MNSVVAPAVLTMVSELKLPNYSNLVAYVRISGTQARTNDKIDVLTRTAACEVPNGNWRGDLSMFRAVTIYMKRIILQRYSTLSSSSKPLQDKITVDSTVLLR